MLNYEFPPLGGGAANANYHILKEFADHKDLYIDLIVSSINEFKMEKFSDNITIHYLNIGKTNNLHNQSNSELIKYSLNVYTYQKKLVCKTNYNLCHAFFGIPCGFVGQYTGLPLIVSLRGSDVPGYNTRFKMLDALFFRRISRKLWQKSKFTIANSIGLRELAHKTSPHQEIGLIPNGVDTDFWTPNTAVKPNKKLRIVSVGRLIPRKGYNYLLDAVDKLPVVIDFVGDGPELQQLKQKAKENGIECIFHGKQNKNEILELLQRANLFVLPSLHEGMSNAVLEAMSCGLPIVMTKVGGSEIIDQNGILVPTQNAEELREAINFYINNTTKIQEHGKRSRNLSLEMSWAKVAKSYYDIYSQTIN